jgi:GR25 family glycosyltransferase involved in LPS biosynthesis
MKTLNDHFKKIYVINLDRRTDRMKECQEEFKKIGVEVERISAIDAKELTDRTELNHKQKTYYAVTSVHRKLMEDATLNKDDNILIFEDDVKFIDNFNEIFNKKIQFLPEDWDMLFIGGNHILHVDGFDLITGDKDFKVTAQNYKSLNYELTKSPCTYTTHAMAINSKFYDTVIKKMKEFPIIPTDNLYVQLQGECNAYTFLPSLAIQRASFSDIENMHLDWGSIPQVNF